MNIVESTLHSACLPVSSEYRSLDGAKRNPGLVFISQRRKARKGFWGKKTIAFDFLGVPGAFARVKSFQSLPVIRCMAHPALAPVTNINDD